MTIDNLRPRAGFDVSDDRLARVAWNRLAEPGDSEAQGLVASLGPVSALDRLLAGKGRSRWLARLETLDPARDLELADDAGARLVVPGDDEWPTGLGRLGIGTPFCLWVRGPLDLGPACARSVAIVGARDATPYGLRVARELADGVGRLGFSVVSGAAFGIDGAAHQGALRRNTPTIAVLAGGVERPYPRAHENLIAQIAATGCVVSESPPGTMPARWRFLERNRVIAALAGAVVVVEAGFRSGSLGTAARAAEANIPVAAVPGPITSPQSYGTNELIREGATCITSVEAVAELALPIGAVTGAERSGRRAEYDGLSPPDLRVFDALPVRSLADAASIGRVAGLDARTVRAALGRLQLRGQAIREGEGWRRPRKRS